MECARACQADEYCEPVYGTCVHCDTICDPARDTAQECNTHCKGFRVPDIPRTTEHGSGYRSTGVDDAAVTMVTATTDNKLIVTMISLIVVFTVVLCFILGRLTAKYKRNTCKKRLRQLCPRTHDGTAVFSCMQCAEDHHHAQDASTRAEEQIELRSESGVKSDVGPRTPAEHRDNSETEHSLIDENKAKSLVDSDPKPLFYGSNDIRSEINNKTIADQPDESELQIVEHHLNTIKSSDCGFLNTRDRHVDKDNSRQHEMFLADNTQSDSLLLSLRSEDPFAEQSNREQISVPINPMQLVDLDMNHWQTTMMMYDAIESELCRLSFVAGCEIERECLRVYVQPNLTTEDCYSKLRDIIPSGTAHLLQIEQLRDGDTLPNMQSVTVGNYNTHISCVDSVRASLNTI